MEDTNSSLPEWFDYVELSISYTCMVFVSLTLPLYVLVVTIMIYLRQHAYKGMFYRIFMIGGVVDIIALINNYLGAIFPAKGWFIGFYLSQGTTIGHIYLIIAWGTRCIQGFTVTLLALNRATAVCCPISHKRLWNSPWANLLLVPQFGIGIVMSALLIPQKFFWKKQAHGIYIQFDDIDFRAKYFKTAYALDSIFVLIIIIINITMILMFKRKYRLRSMSAASNAYLNHKVVGEKQRQENNLTIVSLATCVIEITYYMYIVYAFAIQPYMNTRVFYLIYNMLNDIYGGISAWLIVTLSKMMQIHLKNVFRCLSFTAQKHLHVMAPSTMTLITVPNRSVRGQ